MNKQFLVDAIAEAKTIKEAAIADAKATLEENFSSEAKAMLAAKLQEMEAEDELDEVINETEETVEEEINLDEIEAELTEEYLTSEDKIEEAEEKEDEAEETDEEATDEEEAEEDVEEEVDLEDMTEEELTAYIEEVVGEMIENGEIEPGESFEDETEVEDEGETEEELDFEMEDVTEETVEETEENVSLSLEEQIESLKSELKETKKELYLAYNTVKEQKELAKDTNLLNAKLLYTNKLFLSNKNLNESAKEKILKSFDKAGTVNETKLVYETLKEGFETKSSTKKQVNESIVNKTVKSITETKVAPQVQNEILPTDSWVERNQRLAGIKQY